MLLTGDGPWGACQPGRALFLGEGKRNTASSVRLPARAPWKKLPLWPRHIHPCLPERSGCHSLSHSLTHTHTHSLSHQATLLFSARWLAGWGWVISCVSNTGPRPARRPTMPCTLPRLPIILLPSCRQVQTNPSTQGWILSTGGKGSRLNFSPDCSTCSTCSTSLSLFLPPSLPLDTQLPCPRSPCVANPRSLAQV